MEGTKELTLEIGDFDGQVGKKVDRFEGVHRGNGIGEFNLEGRMLLDLWDQKDLCVGIHGLRRRKGR